jgi:prepilin-type N-terminal cleavage/methylation domain-containing protein
MRCAERKGFTLLELLVVVAVVATLAALTVGIFSAVERSSAEKVSVANQESVMRNVQAFLSSVNQGRLDKLDALIDVSTPAGTAGTLAGNPSGLDANGNTTLNSAIGAVGGVYRGTKFKTWGGAAADSTDRANNDGIHSGLYGKVCVYYLSGTNVIQLKDGLGLQTVWYHNPTADRANNVSAASGIGNCDGSPVISDEGAPGFRVEFTPAFLTALSAGTAVLAVDPLKGAQIYRDLGQPLNLASSATDADALTAAKNTGGVLLLFGLGQQASIIGNSKCGMTRAPRCETLTKQYYRQYLLVVRMRAAGPVSQPAEIVGIIDPKGQSVRQANFYNEWRTNN